MYSYIVYIAIDYKHLLILCCMFIGLSVDLTMNILREIHLRIVFVSCTRFGGPLHLFNIKVEKIGRQPKKNVGYFFGSVFTRETDNENNYPEFESRMHRNNILQNVIFTENDVCEKLERLTEDKACGPDGIHPKLLKECAEIIAKPLYLIFSKSLESGVVPTD